MARAYRPTSQVEFPRRRSRQKRLGLIYPDGTAAILLARSRQWHRLHLYSFTVAPMKTRRLMPRTVAQSALDPVCSG